MHGEVSKNSDTGTLPHLKWRSLQQLVTVESWKVTSSDGFSNNEQYVHVAGVIWPSLLAKLKLDENDHVLKVAPDTLYCFVDMF